MCVIGLTHPSLLFSEKAKMISASRLLFSVRIRRRQTRKSNHAMLTKAPERDAVRTRDGQEGLQSQVIDWLRFPLAVAVVFIHCFGEPPTVDLAAMHADPFSGMHLFNWVRICLSHVLTHIAVPTFFAISGYLFFRKWQQWDKLLYLRKLKSRFRTLVIPYLCWNFIAILTVVALKVAAYAVKGKPLSSIPLFFQENGWLRMFWDCNVWAEDRLNWLGMATPMTSPIDVPLWFLRDLIVVTVLTPLIYVYLKYTRHYGLLLLALAYISGVWPNISGLTVTTVFFFSTGAYFSLYGKNLINECRRVRALSYVCAVLFLLPCIWFDGRNTSEGYLIYPFYVIAGVCAAFNLTAWLLQTGRARIYPLLSQSTFFIYAIHTLLVLRVTSVLFRPLEATGIPWLLTLIYLLRPFVATAICIVLFVLMRRLFPRILGILTGNRN